MTEKKQPVIPGIQNGYGIHRCNVSINNCRHIFLHVIGGISIILLFLAFSQSIHAGETSKKNTVVPYKVMQPVIIDGDLTESVWEKPAINRRFKTYSPNYGELVSEETVVWAAYDKKNLYFAFKCSDSEPGRIKTSISQRDNIMQDDYVGILLDSSGNRQTSYEFYVNPNGIQADAVKSAVSVSGADYAPDFVWHSAGKVTDEGYQVEIRIPLETIRFKAGKNVSMGCVFLRQISRMGISCAWPEIQPGQTTFNFMAVLTYEGLKKSLKLEVLPNFTYSRNEDRYHTESWSRDTDVNVGVGLKYGITSAITAEATINPDFSQVESDAFQVEVNQRYPIFYSEKRPFFMESKDVLDFSVMKWGMMPTPIHTRTIVDPGWAVKLSGAAGKMNFALLGADDRSPGYAWVEGINPDEGKKALFGIFRAKYNIGSDNSIGVLYSGRHFAGQANNVVGVDAKYRLINNLRFGVSYLYSATRDMENGPIRKGNAVNSLIQYDSASFFALAGHEYYDNGFSMATAFLNRGNISRFMMGAGPKFKVKLKTLPWLKRVMPYGYYLSTHDLETKLDDKVIILGLNLSFAPKGYFNFEYLFEDEAWGGIVFPKNYITSEGGIQLVKWLHLSYYMVAGEAIYYDPSEPFMGNACDLTASATVQPSVKLNIGIDYSYSGMNLKKSVLCNDRKVYRVNIYNLRTMYQFNKYFFLRGILRYDSYQEKIMTDLLASFTLIPGTVVHLGYGSLYEKKRWAGNYWVPGGDEFMQMRRGLFFKASYLWRIN